MRKDNVLIILRHFPTIFDLQKRVVPPKSDINILSVNRKKVDNLNSNFKKFSIKNGINSIYSADNTRAINTASLINKKLNLKVNRSSLLNNICNPEWQNLTEKEIIEKYPNKFHRWCTKPSGIKFKHGESIEDVKNRIKIFLNNLSESSLIITHTTPFQLIICQLLNLPINSVWLFKPEFFTFSVIYDQTLFALNAIDLSAITLNYY